MSDPLQNPGVVITSIHHKGAVKYTQSDEYVEITNRGAARANLAGWVLRMGDIGQRFTFPPGTVLAPGQAVRVYTNEVHPETGGFSFASKRSIWNDKGSLARLRDPQGNLVSQLGYGSYDHYNKIPIDTGASTTPTGTSGAQTGDSASLTAKAIWDRVKAHWPDFPFMWLPGSSEEELAAAEARLGVQLPARVRDLMRECSCAAGAFPERGDHGYCADVCLVPVTQWRYLSNWEDERARRLIVIGSNDYLMDYGAYVLLDPGTGEVSSFDLHDERLISEGPFEVWLQQHTVSKDTYLAPPELDELELEEGETVAAAIARRHCNWLSSARVPAWDAVQNKFIETVDRLRAGA